MSLMIGPRREQGRKKNSAQLGPKSWRATLRVPLRYARKTIYKKKPKAINVMALSLCSSAWAPTSQLASWQTLSGLNGNRPAGGWPRRRSKTLRRPPSTEWWTPGWSWEPSWRVGSDPLLQRWWTWTRIWTIFRRQLEHSRIEVDEQERQPGPGSEQSAGANHTQGDWAAWPSTSGGASARASPGGPHCGIACSCPWVMAFGCLRYAHLARQNLAASPQHSSIADAPKANKSMLATGSILQCEHASPTVSFGPRKSWRPIEPWHQHDKGSPGCVSPTRGVHGPSWRCRRPCRARWPSCWTTRRRSPHTPGAAWHQHWPCSCWSAAEKRWPLWGTGRTRATSRMWAKWPSTTRQRSMRPRSRSSLWYGVQTPEVIATIHGGGRESQARGRCRCFTADAWPAYAQSSRRTSARTQRMTAPSDMRHSAEVGSCLRGKNTVQQFATSSEQLWRLRQYQLLPNLQLPGCLQPWVTRHRSPGRGQHQHLPKEPQMTTWQTWCGQLRRRPEELQLPRHPRRPSLWQRQRRLQRRCPKPQWRHPKWHRANVRPKLCQRRGMGSKPATASINILNAWGSDPALLKPPLVSGRQGRAASSSWQGSRCSRQWTSSPRQRCRFAASRMVLRAGGVTFPGAQLVTFAAAYSQERNEQWTDVWPAVKHTVWHGDNVLFHFIKGHHRGAYLGVLCRASLAGDTIEAANNIENRRETELHKAIKDQGMKKWLNKAFQDTAVGTQHPEPQGYAATERSSTHVLVEDGITLCQHKQADGKAKRLVNPCTSTDVFEALAWERPWCDQCLRRAPASWWPPP